MELKRNIREAWWRDMVTGHNELEIQPGAPSAYEMTGLDSTIIMHPQVWKCSGHYDLFHDYMVDCRESNKRYRYDQIFGRRVIMHVKDSATGEMVPYDDLGYVFVTTELQDVHALQDIEKKARKFFDRHRKEKIQYAIFSDNEGNEIYPLSSIKPVDFSKVLAPDATQLGTLTDPREFNLMFETHTGAMSDESSKTFLRPETAQGIFVNFKNVLDSTRVKIPFGIAQIGKSFRNEITPRNFTFRSREFEQMEIEFFCHPSVSPQWYTYWRDLRYQLVS